VAESVLALGVVDRSANDPCQRFGIDHEFDSCWQTNERASESRHWSSSERARARARTIDIDLVVSSRRRACEWVECVREAITTAARDTELVGRGRVLLGELLDVRDGSGRLRKGERQRRVRLERAIRGDWQRKANVLEIQAGV